MTSQAVSNFHNNDNNIAAESFNFNSTPVQEWIDQLDRQTSIEVYENNDDESDANENGWENMNFVQYLLRLSKSIVLWTGICSSFFNAPNTASSANVESYFKNVKQTLNSIIPCRVDEFVCAHIDMMEGLNREASLTYVEFVDAAGGLQSVLNKELELHDYDSESELIQNYCLNSNKSDNTETVSHDYDSESELIQNYGVNSSQNDSHLDNHLNDDSMVTSCVACQNGDAASGAHKCKKCSKFVHILEGCSIPCGDDEGYGEGRICSTCARTVRPVLKPASTASVAPTKITAKLLNEREKWQKKTSSTNSYLRPVPNWNLDQRVQSKPKILMLSNGSLSTTTHKVGKTKVAVRNTCPFDSICQVRHSLALQFCIEV